MARDRKRAKRRPQRRGPDEGNGADPLRPEEDPLSAAHAFGENAPPSGEEAEFEAAMATGGIEADDEDIASAERAARPAAVRAQEGRSGPLTFFRSSWAELQRVQWPNRSQVGQATAVVAGFVVIAGLYLGLADYVAQKIVNLII